MFSRILVAVDGSDSGTVAVDFATALAHDPDARVRVVHVNELIVGGRGVAYESESEAMEIVDRTVATLRAHGIEADGVHYLANCFAVPQRIAEAAQDWGADVIVFGSKRRRRAWLRGRGLRERVTRVTGLPVLAAPSPLKVNHQLRSDALDKELADLLSSATGR